MSAVRSGVVDQICTKVSKPEPKPSIKTRRVRRSALSSIPVPLIFSLRVLIRAKKVSRSVPAARKVRSSWQKV
jgi:hypothetical protein